MGHGCRDRGCMQPFAASSETMCDEHLEQHRARNRRYWKRKHLSGEVIPDRTIRALQQLARDERDERLRKLAEQLGRVPTLQECADELGIRHATGKSVQDSRKRAFGIRARSPQENREKIPYPVPSGWLA